MSSLFDSREFKQWQRWRQQERQKSNNGLDWENNNFECASCLFVNFFFRHCTTVMWKCLFSHFVEDVNTRPRLSFSFPELQYTLLEFNSTKNWQHLMNWTRLNRRDKVWSSVTSLLEWCFRSRHRCCCFSSLVYTWRLHT